MAQYMDPGAGGLANNRHCDLPACADIISLTPKPSNPLEKPLWSWLEDVSYGSQTTASLGVASFSLLTQSERSWGVSVCACVCVSSIKKTISRWHLLTYPVWLTNPSVAWRKNLGHLLHNRDILTAMWHLPFDLSSQSCHSWQETSCCKHLRWDLNDEVSWFVETWLKALHRPFLSKSFWACRSTDQTESVCILTEEQSKGGRFDGS